jgi:hypothetical protein
MIKGFSIEPHFASISIDYRHSLFGNSKAINLQLNVSAKNTDQFKLEMAGCFLEKEKIIFSLVQFNKAEQKVIWSSP